MPLDLPTIKHIDDGHLETLCDKLKSQRPELYGESRWPHTQLEWFCRSGATQLLSSFSVDEGGWDLRDRLLAMILFSEACLSSTFVFTQHFGAVKRLLYRNDSPLFKRRIHDYLSGSRFISLGLSHLHALGSSSLSAEFVQDGVLLNGRIPWVTGAAHVHDVYIGARLADGKSIFLLCQMDPVESISIEPFQDLAALSETATAAINFDQHFISASHVVNVGDDARFGLSTGGLNSCAMALGHAKSALNAIIAIAGDNPHGVSSDQVSSLQQEWEKLKDNVLFSSRDVPTLRAASSEMALRFSQSLLIMQRGTGFKRGALAQLLCRQALFFLVWSNPKESSAALLHHWSSVPSL